MSGFVRPSIVGPCELYGLSELFCQQMAPAANVLGEDAGSVRLPAATGCEIDPTPITYRSNRGAAVAFQLKIVT